MGGAVVSSGAPKLPKARSPAIAATTIIPAIAEIAIILFFIKISHPVVSIAEHRKNMTGKVCLSQILSM